jgi:hypothetical protein
MWVRILAPLLVLVCVGCGGQAKAPVPKFNPATGQVEYPKEAPASTAATKPGTRYYDMNGNPIPPPDRAAEKEAAAPSIGRYTFHIDPTSSSNPVGGGYLLDTVTGELWSVGVETKNGRIGGHILIPVKRMAPKADAQ